MTLPLLAGPVAVQDATADKERGQYFIEHFDLAPYGAYQHFYQLTQDPQGNIYAANVNGIYRYDGSNWHLLPGTLNLKVRKLVAVGDGKIFVGGNNYFGYLLADNGHYAFHSLKVHLPDPDSNTGMVWQVVSRPEGVYFHTPRQIFLWHKQQLEVIKPTHSSFYLMFVVDDKLLVQQRHKGLFEVKNGKMTAVADGAFFADKTISALFSWGDGLLLFTEHRGLYIFDGQQFTPFNIQRGELLADQWLYFGLKLKNGQLALCLDGDNPGVLLLDQQGQFIHFLTEAGWPSVKNSRTITINGIFLLSSAFLHHPSRLFLPKTMALCGLKAAINCCVLIATNISAILRCWPLLSIVSCF